jgi:hypothetical protein
MRTILAWLLAAAFLAGATAPSSATVRIAGDLGGTIGVYIDRYERLRAARETVEIDGVCASACTLVLASLPAERICVTDRASLGFHAAWDFDGDGLPVSNPSATSTIYDLYPAPVRRWIADHGGLTSRLIYLKGGELRAMYRTCYDPRGPMYLERPTQPVYYRR